MAPAEDISDSDYIISNPLCSG